MIGFVTRDSIKDLPFGQPDSQEVLVYIPLSYQIGGFMIAMPPSKFKVLDWPMDSAMSFVLTAGMASGDKNAVSPHPPCGYLLPKREKGSSGSQRFDPLWGSDQHFIGAALRK